MGARTRGFANLLNTDGTFLSGAINNTSLSGISDIAATAKSDMVPIIGYGFGSDAAMEHVDGGRSGVAVLDNTYSAYVFKFNNVHPSNDNVEFQWNGSVDAGSNYNVTKTTTVWQAGHDESGSSASLGYDSGADKKQSTAYSRLARNCSSDADHGTSGELWLWNPASTTFMKPFFSRTTSSDRNNFSYHLFTGGYLNTTSAVDAVIFKFSSGTLESGDCRVYGLK